MTKDVTGKGRLKRFRKGLVSLIAVLGASAALAAPSAVLAQEEDPAQAQFLKAMDARAKGNLYEAMDIFSNLLANQPLLHRARLELAVTYYRMYNYEKAKKMAQQVLDDPKTPDNVRVAILAFIAQIDKDAEAFAKRHYWKPTVALGWMHDTNVNAGPDANLVNIGGNIFQLTPGSLRHSDSAAIAMASLNHRYQTGKTFRAGQKNGMLLWLSQASLYHRDYFDEHAFDMDVLSLSTGPAWVMVGDWRANIDAKVDYLELGSDEFAWIMSLAPSITKQFQQGSVEVTLDGTLSDRDYQQDADSARDSTFTALQLSLGKRFTRPKVEMMVGGNVFSEDADRGDYSNDGHEVYLSATWQPWTNGAIFGRISEKNIEYDDPPPLHTAARDERESRYSIGVSHTLQYKWLKDTTISCNFMRTENNSNSPLYEYTRKQLTVMLSKTF